MATQLQAEFEEVSDIRRQRARVVADRLVEEGGLKPTDALTLALAEMDRDDPSARIHSFRRTGLRWDE